MGRSYNQGKVEDTKQKCCSCGGSLTLYEPPPSLCEASELACTNEACPLVDKNQIKLRR